MSYSRIAITREARARMQEREGERSEGRKRREGEKRADDADPITNIDFLFRAVQSLTHTRDILYADGYYMCVYGEWKRYEERRGGWRIVFRSGSIG